MNTKIKAFIALAGTVLFFSILVIFARLYVHDVSPMMLLFLRALSAGLCFLPFFLRSYVWKKKRFISLCLVSLLSTVNVVFFIWGIGFTTASASQLIYAIQPMLTILVTKYLFKENQYGWRSFVGVLVGLIGISYILYQSAVKSGETIAGGLWGNTLIIIAMLGWFWYVLLSKKLSRYFSPVEIGSTSVLISLFVTTLLLMWQIKTANIVIHLTPISFMAALYMGIFGTFLTYILMQYAIKYLSPLSINMTSYVQPIFVAILAIFFLGEKMTASFVIGAMMVFISIFLTATVEFLKINSNKTPH